MNDQLPKVKGKIENYSLTQDNCSIDKSIQFEYYDNLQKQNEDQELTAQIMLINMDSCIKKQDDTILKVGREDRIAKLKEEAIKELKSPERNDLAFANELSLSLSTAIENRWVIESKDIKQIKKIKVIKLNNI